MATRRQSLALLIGIGVLTGATMLAPTGAAALAAGATTSRVSIASTGGQGNGASFEPHVSASGRYVAFSSEGSNLVPGDSNGVSDVFVRDRTAGMTRRVSVGPGGAQANERSFTEAVSADGRYVFFTSHASNLVAGDTNGVGDLFVRDVQAGITERVSLSSTGQQANSGIFNFVTAISPDGRYVAFTTAASTLVPGDTNGPFDGDVFLRDRVAHTTKRVSVGAAGRQLTGSSSASGVSADGRYVVFTSFADNAVSGDTNFSADVFIRDRQAGTTRRLSVGPGGQQALEGDSVGEGISPDGRFVLFTSKAANLVNGDTNGVSDVFIRDRQAALTRRVSLNTSGGQANGPSNHASMSFDGRYLSMDSEASNLAAGDTNDRLDVFVRDLLAGVTQRVSVSSSGAQAARHSAAGRISADGRHVVFQSEASILVPGDTNGVLDVFARDEFGDIG